MTDASIKHQSSSITSQVSGVSAGPKTNVCTPCTNCLSWFFNDTVVGGSLNEEWGATFNFLFAHIIFWAVGLPNALDFGFEDTRNGDDSKSRAV